MDRDRTDVDEDNRWLPCVDTLQSAEDAWRSADNAWWAAEMAWQAAERDWQSSSDDRRAAADARRAADDAWRAADDAWKVAKDAWQATKDAWQAMEDYQRAAEDVQRASEDVQRTGKEIQRSTEDVQRATEDVQRDVTEDIQRATEDVQRVEEDVQRTTEDNWRSYDVDWRGDESNLHTGEDEALDTREDLPNDEDVMDEDVSLDAEDFYGSFYTRGLDVDIGFAENKVPLGIESKVNKRKATDAFENEDSNKPCSKQATLMCPVCHDPLEGERTVCSTCGHLLRANCMTKILTSWRRKCPICRMDIPPKSIRPLYF